MILLISEIPNNHLGCKKPVVNNGRFQLPTSTGEFIPDFRDPSTVSFLTLQIPVTDIATHLIYIEVQVCEKNLNTKKNHRLREGNGPVVVQRSTVCCFWWILLEEYRQSANFCHHNVTQLLVLESQIIALIP